jgi:ectoine hydroxylase-related dioxygenase (phytanoyl-CoA dioxygenase family)
MRNLTGAEIDHFRQYGFVRLRQLIAEESMTRLTVAMSLAIDTFELSPSGCDLTAFAEDASAYAATGTSGRAPRPGPFCAAALGEAMRRTGARPLSDKAIAKQRPGRSLFDLNASQRVPELRGLALDTDLPRIAAALIDTPAVRLYDDVMCVKEPGAIDRAAFHQDLSYLHVGGERGCVFWIFVDPVREGGGALGYVPASHKWKQEFKANFMVSDLACPGSEGADLPGIDASPEAFGVQYVESEPGDVIAHHVLTVYGKQGNRGTEPCRGFALRYVDADLPFKRRQGVALPAGMNAAPRDGSALDETRHPLAWPQK